MVNKVELNDEVYAQGKNGVRFIVVGLKEEGTAILQQFAFEKATGISVYYAKTTEVPIGALTVFGKNHLKPSNHKILHYNPPSIENIGQE